MKDIILNLYLQITSKAKMQKKMGSLPGKSR